MKVLFLDDDEFRHVVMKTEMKTLHAELTSVRTAREAVAAVERQKFDIILLDHDLGGEVYVPSGPGTGFEVAERIPGSVNRDTPVIVHTLNEAGAKNMLAAIGARAEWIPFTRLGDLLTRLRRA